MSKRLAKIRRTTKRVFISHSSATRDTALAGCFDKTLRAAGLSVFFDARSLNPGLDWQREIEHKISRSNLFILVWSDEAKKAKWVKPEVDLAIKLETEQGKPKIIPILIEKCLVPGFLSRKQYIPYYRLTLIEALELFQKGLQLGKRFVQSNLRMLSRLFWLAEVAPENKNDVFLIDHKDGFAQSDIYKHLRKYVFPFLPYRNPMTNHWAENDLKEVLRQCLGLFLGKDNLGEIAKGQSFPQQLESAMIRESNGSIERMFRLVDSLFDKTAYRWANSHREKRITRADWEAVLRKVAG